jgi:SAM-dependent methyltransferase
MKEIYRAKFFPILQNRVYLNADDAINCSTGDIKIVSNDSGFIYNADFDASKMEYDEEYDNSVPSQYFKKYYLSIIEYLKKKYNLDSKSVILDIGCGKGTFLKQMFSETSFDGKGIGIDPSYEGEEILFDGRLMFIKEYFNESHLKNIEHISLILLRHTLEHIPEPSKFLESLFDIIKKSNLKNIPIFIEVPDVQWIFENNAYWDFFYEHVNYFSKNSLYQTITNANGVVTSIQSAFGEQYQWAEAYINSDSNKLLQQISPPIMFDQDLDFNKEIINTVQRLRNKLQEKELVIWDMASKGIIYSLHLLNNNIEPSYFIDINESKQNKYLPILGKKICAPIELPLDKSLLVVCMNPNYFNEIFNDCNNLKLNFELISPNI